MCVEVDDYIGVQKRGSRGFWAEAELSWGRSAKGSEVNSSKSIARWMEGWEAGQRRLRGLGGGGVDARRRRRLEGVSGASAWAENLHA